MPNSHGSVNGIVTIGTNSSNGMILTVADKDANTYLLGNDAASTHIDTGTGAVADGVSKWNISAVSASTTVTTEGSEYTPLASVTNAAMVASTDSPITIYTGTKAEEADVTMSYNFGTAANQPAGVYTDTITYSVSIND
ncbi:hypothetical protein IJF91_01870 [Candidatus Saccharibacteria bacterium]|nr:hypothetical protein [Candidatus Saccharibacteria bacterium]